MNSNYDIFFSIDLYHEYYLNRTCNDFEIVPSRDTMELAKRLNIQWRKKSNGLVAFILENGNQEPAVNVALEKNFRRYYDKSVLRFYLKLNNPDFLNYTNTAQVNASRVKHYFSNLADNEDFYLTTPAPDYSNGKMYLPGNLVRDAVTGNMYEALKKHTPRKKSQLQDDALWAPKGLQRSSKKIDEFEPGKNYAAGDVVKDAADGRVYEAAVKHTAASAEQLSDTAFWIAKASGRLQYPTENDVIGYCNSQYTFQLPAPVSKADVSLFSFNYSIDKPDFDVPVAHTTLHFETATSNIPISFNNLQPGRYRVQVDKESSIIYFDPYLTESNAWAVIELFNHLPGNHPYALLTEDEKLRQTRYQVQFANRRVLWKYIRKDDRADQITDTAENGYEFNLRGDDFVSASPIPLTENTLKTLKLEFSSKDFRMYPLPNPGINRLVRYNQDEYDYLCSEVVLNY